ncbi:MAG TPA: hypothetical protein V6C72_04575, partial [Chroococcales cyanobacterium]
EPATYFWHCPKVGKKLGQAPSSWAMVVNNHNHLRNSLFQHTPGMPELLKQSSICKIVILNNSIARTISHWPFKLQH